MLVLNKADFLTKELRIKWSKYFKSQNIDYVFFSSLYNNPNNIQNAKNSENTNDQVTQICEQEDEDEDDDYKIYNTKLLLNKINQYKLKHYQLLDSIELSERNTTADSYLHEKSDQITKKRNYIVGFVGYPNVGKSSLINCLMETTKTCVGTQPGKTKHIQTLYLKDTDIILCDCPGLIFPNLVCTKYHLLINNIVSTSHFKGNMILAVQLICNLIPIKLCEKYDININDCLITNLASNRQRNTSNSLSTSTTESPEGQEQKEDKILFSVKVLELLCKNRNYISAGKGGQLDYTRACKLIINDFTQGSLLYCKQPPDFDENLKFKKKTEVKCVNNLPSDQGLDHSLRETLSENLERELGGLHITPNTNENNNVNYFGKTINESKKDEDNINQWLKQQLKQEDKVKMTKRKMRFLIKGKRKN